MATLADPQVQFAHTAHPAPTAVAVRAEVLANPGFGSRFTDHMVSIDWSEDMGWHNPAVLPYGPIALDPAAAVLHYAQEIFEGLKAYRHPDGSMALFRPDANARRFNASARRLAMPELPEELFIQAIRELVAVDGDWFPTVEGGSLYLRPFMIATEVFLGVKPSNDCVFAVIASPVGSYFKGGPAPVSIWVSENFTRAAIGGTGAVKCGGNYAASLRAQAEAIERGCDQVVFLDAVERGIGLGRGGTDVLGLSVGKVGTHAGEGIRVDHIHRSDGAAKGLGQACGLGDGQHGGLGTVDRNQNVLEHGASPWVE